MADEFDPPEESQPPENLESSDGLDQSEAVEPLEFDEIDEAPEPVQPVVPLFGTAAIEPVIGYQLPRKRVGPPRMSEVIVVIVSSVVAFSCLGTGVLGLIEEWTDYSRGDSVCSVSCLIFGGLAVYYGVTTWRGSKSRRKARASVPRYCDRCGCSLTGLAVVNCPGCGTPHKDSPAAIAGRLRDFSTEDPTEN